MSRKTVIYKNILENMTDGVMTLDIKGKITTFNPAAEKILGIEREDVIDKTFAGIFFQYDGNDDFNQVILDAIYESNDVHNRIVDFNAGGNTVYLSLTTSFLKGGEDGGSEKIGVIAVFNDVTELKKLQDAEIRLTDDLKSKHAELRDAYLKVEQSNMNLESALKKVQVVRITATIFIIAIFLGTGFFFWNKTIKPKARTTVKSLETTGSRTRTITVGPQSVSSTISLHGNLEPLKLVNIVSPLSGSVKEKLFNYGDKVEKGMVLIKMDTSKIESEYRRAKASYLKITQRLTELENWENGMEVKRSRQALTLAALSLKSLKRKLHDTERLFNMGIVPTSEYDSMKEQLVNMQLNYNASQQALKAVLNRADKRNIEIARLENINAQLKMKDLKDQMGRSIIKAPVSGIVILPVSSSGKKDKKEPEKGISFDKGQIMFAIGDLEGLSIKVSVDEVDISKIKKGQKAIISGDAFPDIVFDGKIFNISSQATAKRNIPAFDITVIVEHVTPEQRRKLRLGMSANIEVVIYNRPDALMVPIRAVTNKAGGSFIRIKDKETMRIREAKVETGITTLDSVEIIEGLKQGDDVVIE